ncbi:MAG: tetratricopeptide repeat protein [Thermoanaerobaculia bacterium]
MAIDRPQVIASAEKLVSRGKIEAAIKEYRKLLAENPNDASTLNRLGDLYARIDRIDEAVRLFSQIADRYTDDGFFVKAIAIYKKIIKLDPTRLTVYERLAELYHKQGLIPEARTQYQVLVDYYQKHANSASAIGVLQKMAILIPDDPAPHVKLAELFHSQKLTDKALAEYRLIADLMLRHNKVEEATQVYAKAIEAEPGDIAFITDAVLGLKDAGHVGAAARLLALAVERNPQAEKIARIAGLHRSSPAPAVEELRAPTVPLKVSDVTRSGTEPRDVLDLDSNLLETSSFQVVRAAPATPASEPHRPPLVVPPLLKAVDEGEVDFVLELPEDLDAPSTQVSPTDDMLRRSPESPWFDAGEDGEVEFDLDIEGLQELEAVPSGASPVAPAFDDFALPATAAPEPPAPPTVQPTVQPIAPPPTTFAPKVPAPLPTSSAGADSLLAAGAAESEEVYEIDWNFEPEPKLDIPEVAAPRMAAPELNLEELERTSYEVLPTQVSGARRQDDLLAEAEVFRKYGLREKAHDRVRELLQINPRHVGANGLLVSLWIDEGKYEKALARANQLKRLAEEGKDESVWHQVRNRLIKAGFRVEGEEVVGLPAPTPKKKDKITALLDDLAGRSAASTKSAVKPAAARPPAPTPVVAAPFLLEPTPAVPRADPPPAARAPAPPSAPAASELSSEPWHAALNEAGPLDDELPEIVIPILRPPKSGVPAKAPFLSPAAPAAPRDQPVAESKSAVTPERLAADESLSWLDQAVASPATPGATEGEKLFDDEEGFFDLAAELESELSKEDLLTGRDLMPTPQEQSLEEIVEGFKRGVAESLSSEDYDTHYNLGIAYREMGLLDEAIGEFQLASKEPRYLIDCASLLGGCFLEKGLPELAIKWYQRGLEIPHLPEEAFQGILYDLGNVYMFQGDLEKARKTFVEIYGVNSNYRDVVAKLAELDRGR